MYLQTQYMVASHVPPSGQMWVLHVSLPAERKRPIRFTDTGMWSGYLGKQSLEHRLFSELQERIMEEIDGKGKISKNVMVCK